MTPGLRLRAAVHKADLWQSAFHALCMAIGATDPALLGRDTEEEIPDALLKVVHTLTEDGHPLPDADTRERRRKAAEDAVEQLREVVKEEV